MVFIPLVLLLCSCAHTRHFAWDNVNAHYVLTDWPSKSVTARVADGRREKTDDSAQLVRLTTNVVTEALLAARGEPGPAQVLNVEILEHEVSIRGSNWYGVTRFRATLSRDGQVLQTWTANGADKRWNVLPAYVDADNSSKEAYKEAIKDLMAQLAAYRPAALPRSPSSMPQPALSEPAPATPPARSTPPPVITPAKQAQIELLERLRDSGSLTADQFEIERAKVILAPGG